MPALQPVMNGEELIEIRELVRSVVIARHVKDYAIRIVLASHADSPAAPPLTRRYVRHGASPRGAMSAILTAKAFALFDGRLNVSFGDLEAAAPAALRHRILLNFEGEAEGIDIEDLIAEIIRDTPVAEEQARR
jgi:MoxR-like ATPase